MYEKPQLETFGTFRELTQFGGVGGFDALTVGGDPTAPTNGVDNGCTPGASGAFGCMEDLS